MKPDPVSILLVDDQPSKLLSCEAILEELDEIILTATSAREAFEHLLKHPVAVILIDVCMPELDGFELAGMVRGHPRFQNTPIIFVSAIALTDIDRLKGYEHGGVDYVPVPVVPEVLRAKVRVFVELYRKSRQLELLNGELERRVAERTAELELTNAELERRVEERTQERETALAQIHQMQKLESLGQLTGGLAHDFNNVLMAILGNLEMVERQLIHDGPLNAKVGSAIQAAERGAALTQRMLAFARRQELRPKAVDVGSLFTGMLEMLRRSLGPTIELSMDFGIDLPRVHVDPNQLELGILNLCLNSRDAMPAGGQLLATARGEQVRAGQVAGLAAGDYVCVAVADTGMGMDEATLKRAAEPFFTTKGVGKGTGLGLSMVHGLAAQSGGTARIVSAPGEGTTVELWLPVAHVAEMTLEEEPEVANVESESARTILLVDDDPLVAQVTASMLECLGHRIIVCQSGAEAMEVIKADRALDLVITDHAMPGMTGRELARWIQQSGTGLPVILATGYEDFSTKPESDMLRLHKPYRVDDLANAIAEALGAAIARGAAPDARAAEGEAPGHEAIVLRAQA